MQRNNNDNLIIIIEDDEDDQQLFKSVFDELGYSNEVLFFGDGQSALDYLTTTSILPFLILSDINMPKLNGFELREKIKTDAALELKCIPYIFFTTAAEQRAVVDAYSMSVQGFFVKDHKYEDLLDTLRTIIHYWRKCVAPNRF